MLHYPRRQIATNPATYDGLGVENKSNFDFEKCTEALESGAEQKAVIVIYLRSGNTVTINSPEIWESGLTLDKNFSSNNSEFPLGSCVSTKVEFDIVNKTYIDNQNNEVSPYDFKNCRARVTIYVRCKDNGVEETFDRDVYLGYFILQEIDFSETHFTISGNDYMAYLGFSYNDLMAKGVVDQSDARKNVTNISWTTTSDPSNLFYPDRFLRELFKRCALFYIGSHANIRSVLPSNEYLDLNSSNIFHDQYNMGDGQGNTIIYYGVYASSENSTMTMAEMIGEFVGLYGFNLYIDDKGRLMPTLYSVNSDNIYYLQTKRCFSHKYYSNTFKEFYFRSSIFLKTQDFEKYQYIYLDQNKFMKGKPAYGYNVWPDTWDGETEPDIKNKRFTVQRDWVHPTPISWIIKSKTIFAFEAEVLPAPYLSPDDYIYISMPDLEIPGHTGGISTYLTSVTYTLNGRTRIACDVRYEDNKYLYQ